MKTDYPIAHELFDELWSLARRQQGLARPGSLSRPWCASSAFAVTDFAAATFAAAGTAVGELLEAAVEINAPIGLLLYRVLEGVQVLAETVARLLDSESYLLRCFIRRPPERSQHSARERGGSCAIWLYPVNTGTCRRRPTPRS